MQLKEACDDFLSGYFSTHDRSAKTRAAYRSDLMQFQEFAGSSLAVTDLGSTVVECWADTLRQDGYSPASVRRKIVVLKGFCSYWARKGALKESPFWHVRLSFGRLIQLPRTLTEQEMRDLLNQARRNRHDAARGGDRLASTRIGRPSCPYYRAIRNLALVDLLFATGMRVGEASALDAHDFRAQEAVFRVQGKGRRDRLAFAADEQSLRIQLDHLEARKQIGTQCSALFLNHFGERLSTQGISNVIAQLRCEAGIERHVTPHMLRHTVATLLLRNGVDIRVVQEFLGHTSIVTTQRYTHVSKEHMIAILRKHHPSIGLRAEAE